MLEYRPSKQNVLLACNAVLPNSHGAELSNCDGALRNYVCVGETEKIKWSKFYKQDRTNFKIMQSCKYQFSVLDNTCKSATLHLQFIALACEH